MVAVDQLVLEPRFVSGYTFDLPIAFWLLVFDFRRTCTSHIAGGGREERLPFRHLD
jgi:hypothetical protein